jgi:fibronectin-binding autotransporter adhesin
MHIGIAIVSRPLAGWQRHASWRSNKGSFRFLTILVAMLLSSTAFTSAEAQTLSWGAAGGGGTGTWDTSAANWFDGTSAGLWVQGDSASFAGTAGTVTLGAPITIQNMAFATNGYTITGTAPNTLTLAGTAATITTNAGVSATINSVLAGSAALVKTGAGTLAINNGTNSYAGGTTVSQGTLTFGANNALGSGTITLGDANTGTSNVSLLASFPNFSLGQYIPNNIVVSSSGTGTVSIGSTSFSAGSNGTIYAGTITLNGDVTLLGGNADRTSFNGKITGTGNITVTGNRVTIDNGTNDFVGTLTIAAGHILQVDASFVIPKTATLNILGNGQLRFANNSQMIIDGFNGSATAIMQVVTGSRQPFAVGASNGSGAYAGIIGNVIASFTKLGTGTQVLSGANIYTGVTTISGGILSTQLLANGGVASGIGQSTNAAANLVLDGGTLQYTGAGASTDRQFTLTANGGGIDASGTGTLTFANTAAIALSGAGSRALTLTGTNTATNTLAASLGDSGGPSSLIKSGAGRWVLTASNSYTGGTVLNAGTLQVSADANLGDAAGALTFNGGTLENTAAFSSGRAVTVNSGGGVFQTDTDLILSGIISGSGALTKTGAASLILIGNDSYAGGTTISTGILQIGNGGTSGAIVGDVADNGALVFDRSDAISLAGVISGTGMVSQIGAGATTLTGINTYAGGTTITAGTLIGSATSFGSGAILDNAALVIDQPADGAMANAINGSGSFTKLGAGRLNYTGTGNLAGPTTVAAGLLSVNGSLASSAATVQNGASLGGNGTVGATTVQSGGTIAPGNSIGTLHINGAFVQNGTSVYQVEVDPNSNASDLIAITGTATLQSGAGLNVSKYVPGDYQVGTVYKVLSATNGLTGTYILSGQTTGVSAFLGLKDSYDANNAYLTVVQTQDLTTAATTPNQQEVAQAVDAAPPADPVPAAVLNLPDAPSARAAFDQLSGQVQASVQGALLANGLYVREVAIDRLRDVICAPDASRATDSRQIECDGKRLSFWGQGFGGWGGIAGNANATGLNHSAAGFLVGVDVPVEDVRLGVFGGYSHGDFHLVSGGAAGDSNDYHLGVYGGTLLDGIAVRAGASYSWNGITTDRAVQIGDFTDALHGVYNAGTIQAFGELGYGLATGWGSLEPFANLSYVSLHTGGFTEAGGPAALTVRASTVDDVISTLGVRPSTTISLGGLDGVLRGMMGWRHTFGRVEPVSTVSFAGGNPFSVGGAPIARDAAAVEAGLDVTVEEGVTLGLTYDGQFSGRRSTDQMARGTIRFSF